LDYEKICWVRIEQAHHFTPAVSIGNPREFIQAEKPGFFISIMLTVWYDRSFQFHWIDERIFPKLNRLTLVEVIDGAF